MFGELLLFVCWLFANQLISLPVQNCVTAVSVCGVIPSTSSAESCQRIFAVRSRVSIAAYGCCVQVHFYCSRTTFALGTAAYSVHQYSKYYNITYHIVYMLPLFPVIRGWRWY